jgi:hypothetical protein
MILKQRFILLVFIKFYVPKLVLASLEFDICQLQLHNYRWNMVVAMLLVVVGPAGRPDHDQQHCCLHVPTVKPEAATAVVVAPDDGREDARNMLSCK